MTRVVFVRSGAGGGHTASANALKEAIEERRAPLEVVPANLQEILFSADFVRRLTGVPVEDFYNRMLRGGVTLGMRQMLRVGQLLIRSRHRLIRKRLREYWERARPSMVVSFIPNFNRALRESLCSAFPEAPFVTIMTDLADFPPPLLDRAAGPTHRLRYGARGRAGAGSRHRARKGLAHLGDDCSPSVL